MNGVIALVALSPIRKAHCVISGSIPIRANTGTKINAINAHLAVAETIIRLMVAVNNINKIKVHKGPACTEDSKLAPMIATHLSKCEYYRQANIWAAKKAITR